LEQLATSPLGTYLGVFCYIDGAFVDCVMYRVPVGGGREADTAVW